MKKRSKLIATLVASVMCLGLIVYGVYALTVSFALNSTFSFEANGVYVGVWGQVYTGATGTDLQPLTTDASYTYGEVKNFTAKEDGTPDGSKKSQETIEAWKPANVALDEIKPYLLYKVTFKNYAPYAIAIIPNNTTTPAENVTMREDKIALANVAAGATVSYTISFEVTKFLEDIPQTAVTVSYTLRKATADDYVVDENWFNVTPDGQVKGMNTTYYTDETAPETLVIPATINGIIVKTIGDDARSFKNTLKAKTTKIILAEGIEEIFRSAFLECSNITSIQIADSITTIYGTAFENCSALTEILISEDSKLTNLNDAFAGCDKLSKLFIPKGVTNLDNISDTNNQVSNAFYGLSNCAFEVSKNHPKYINDENGDLLEALTDGYKLIRIGLIDEYGCFTIDGSVVEMAKGSIGGNKALQALYIPASVTTIGDIFDTPASTDGCKNLKFICVEGNGYYCRLGVDDNSTWIRTDSESEPNWETGTSVTEIVDAGYYHHKPGYGYSE